MLTKQKMFDINIQEQKLFNCLTVPKQGCGREEMPRLTGLRSLVTCVLIALLMSGLALLLWPNLSALALTRDNAGGYVYVLNKDLSGSNSIWRKPLAITVASCMRWTPDCC